jgi:hypothetical protein
MRELSVKLKSADRLGTGLEKLTYNFKCVFRRGAFNLACLKRRLMIEKPWRDKQSWAAQGYDRDWKWKLEKEIYKSATSHAIT